MWGVLGSVRDPQRQRDLERELLDLVQVIGWSRHFVEIDWDNPNFFHSKEREEVAKWCTSNIGSPYRPFRLDITMIRRLRYQQLSNNEPNELIRSGVMFLRAAGINTTTYAFRRDEDAVHFKLRWF